MRTFHPNAVDEAGAAALETAPGEERENVNFKLARVRTFRVRGQIMDDPSASIALVPDSVSTSVEWMRAKRQGERFEFSGVLPGAYHLVAAKPRAERRSWMRQSISVGSADIDGLTIRIPPTGSIAGHVRVEAETAPDISQVRIGVQSAYPNFLVYDSPSDKPAKDGTFQIAGFAPDRYKVIASSDVFYVKSVRLGDRELPGQILDLSGSAQIEVVLSRNSAIVTGQASLDQRPVSEAAIVLVPLESERRDDSAAYRFVRTDDSGKFTLNHVVPGRYAAFAWDGMENNDYRYMDPDVVRSLEGKAVLVTVEEGSRLNIELIVMPAGNP